MRYNIMIYLVAIGQNASVDQVLGENQNNTIYGQVAPPLLARIYYRAWQGGGGTSKPNLQSYCRLQWNGLYRPFCQVNLDLFRPSRSRASSMQSGHAWTTPPPPHRCVQLSLDKRACRRNSNFSRRRPDTLSTHSSECKLATFPRPRSETHPLGNYLPRYTYTTVGTQSIPPGGLRGHNFQRRPAKPARPTRLDIGVVVLSDIPKRAIGVGCDVPASLSIFLP